MNFCRLRRTSSCSDVNSGIGIFPFGFFIDLIYRSSFWSFSCLPVANDQLQTHLAAGEILHDLLRAAADRVDFDFAIDALDLRAADVAGATEYLYGFTGAESHRLRRLIFQHTDFRDR